MPLSKQDIEFLDSHGKTKTRVLKYMKETYPNISSQITKFYEARKYLGKDWQPPKSYLNRRKNETKTRLEQKRDIISMDKDIFETLDSRVSESKRTNSMWKAIYRLVIQLQTASGRRISEIVALDFKVHDEILYFSPMKKKQKTYEQVKYLLFITPEEFMKKLEELSKYIKSFNLSKEKIRLNLNGFLNNHVQHGLTTHDLRGLYLAYVLKYTLSEKVNQSNRTEVASQVLNHSNRESIASYDRYNITEM